LLLFYRGVVGMGLTSAVDFRLVAAALAALLVVLTIALAGRTGGRIPALIAGGLVATAGASPFIESFTLSPELVAAVVSTAAILAFAQHQTSGRARWLIPAGVAAGSAWMVKQSAFDAALAIAVVIGLRRPRALTVFVLFALAPIMAGIILSGAPGAWYGDVIAYGFHASAVASSVSTRVGLLAKSLWPAAEALGLLALLTSLSWKSAPPLVRCWAVTSMLGVVVGGNFHTHYYLQLVVPLALAAAFVRVNSFRPLAVTAAAAAATVAFAIPLWGDTDAAQARAIWPHDPHLRSDAAVARFVDQHSRSSQRIYVMWADADLYYLAQRAPAYPYLWLRNLQTIRGAVAGARQMLDRQSAVIVVVEEPPSLLDRSGATAAALHDNYRLVSRIDGIGVYARRR